MVNVTFQQQPVSLKGDQLKIGDNAPDFSVLSNDLKKVSLSDYDKKIKLISVVPSIDTGVCSKQTQRFNDEAKELNGVEVLTISMDLPFAQARWKEVNEVENITLLSDHRDGEFGEKYGVLIEELRLLARSIFVIDSTNKVTYVEYVEEVTNHPDYDQALAQAKAAK